MSQEDAVQPTPRQGPRGRQGAAREAQQKEPGQVHQDP